MKKQPIVFCLVLSFWLMAMPLTTHRASVYSSVASARQLSGGLQLPGLRDSLTVRRDERGIPYIEAANDDDLYFAQGYVVASDRLWQMELLRRTGRGELAEILGRAAVEQDKLHRSFRFAALSEQMVSRLSAPARASFEAYSRGVNAFIESLDEKSLPPEFELLKLKPRPWRPADSLVIGKVLAETLTTTWERDVMREALRDLPTERKEAVMPTTSALDVIMVGSDQADNVAGKKSVALSRRAKLPPGEAELEQTLHRISKIADETRSSLERVGMYAEELAASNNWVVSGKRSATGKPLLANDPHLSPSAPSIWYMAHLSAPGLRVAGVTVAGVPGILIGHNERIAWGVTNVGADVQDVYYEKVDKDNARRYMTPSGWREADAYREQINVRKAPMELSSETVEYEVTLTRHGPVILQKGDLRYALAWTTIDPMANELEVYYAINRARNWQDFQSALSRYTGFPLNFVYADLDGHIGYWAAGRYPIRKNGGGTTPQDGATDAGDWTGHIPFQATPHVYDPPSGIIVTANNRTIGRSYPYYITDEWSAPYRARRIYNLLTAKERLSVDDFRAIQADTYSFPDAIFAAEVVKLGRPHAATSPEWGQIVGAFEGFDARMSVESKVMPLVNSMRDAFCRRIIAGALGIDRARRYGWANSGTFFDRVITERPSEYLPKEFDSYEEVLLACYKDARESLSKKLGADSSQWSWGRFTQVRFRHALASDTLTGARFVIAPVPENGGPPTVNRARLVSMRYIADVSSWDNTRQGIPLGQSGNPGSPHWKDQLSDWLAVTPAAFPFSKKAVESAAKETLILAPPRVNDHSKQ